jgi:hypothetical protein
MALGLMANWEQMVRKLDRATAQIVKVTRNENVLSAQASFNVIGTVNAPTLLGITL